MFKQLVRYCLVGCVGIFLDLGTIWSLVEFLHLHYRLAAVFSFVLSVSAAFLVNRIWTFTSGSGPKIKQYLKYSFVALVGVLANVILITILVEDFNLWYLFSQAILNPVLGFCAFLANRRWTFRKKMSEKTRF